MRPISPRVRQRLNSLGIRVDIQDTRNAAAQYNLLATERGLNAVAGALIPLGFKEGIGVKWAQPLYGIRRSKPDLSCKSIAGMRHSLIQAHYNAVFFKIRLNTAIRRSLWDWLASSCAGSISHGDMRAGESRPAPCISTHLQTVQCEQIKKASTFPSWNPHLGRECQLQGRYT